jgi:hypothetical protein
MSAFQLYNHTRLKLWTNGFPTTDTYKVMLASSSYTFSAAHTVIGSVNAYEVYGYGWPQGGVTVTNIVITTSGTNGVKFDGDDALQLITEADLGPYAHWVLYNSTTGDLVGCTTLDAEATIEDGITGGVVFNSAGIIADVGT